EYLHSNFIIISQLVSPARILAVVKSDAYGHGAVVIARELQASGAAFFGTATVSEAIQLRTAGITIPILILSGIVREQLLLRDHDVEAQWIHASNSAGLLNFPEARFTLVRAGLLLYGISPVEAAVGFQPILSLKSKIIFLHWIHKGETIGYGRTFTAERDTFLGPLPT